jgi:hypothetical protein
VAEQAQADTTAAATAEARGLEVGAGASGDGVAEEPEGTAAPAATAEDEAESGMARGLTLVMPRDATRSSTSLVAPLVLPASTPTTSAQAGGRA